MNFTVFSFKWGVSLLNDRQHMWISNFTPIIFNEDKSSKFLVRTYRKVVRNLWGKKSIMDDMEHQVYISQLFI